MNNNLKHPLPFNDITKPVGGIITDDLHNIFYQDTPQRKPKDLHISGWYTQHSKIDKKSLEKFGTDILNDSLSKNVAAYHVSIPSENIITTNHAVAMMIDHKNKEILYHDSYGKNMRREMKDFLTELLPDYEQKIDYEQQQFREDNDQSCALLTTYNLRDMWFMKTGEYDKVRNYRSVEARKDAYDLLKDIEKEEPKPSKIKINRMTSGTPRQMTQEEIDEEKKATEADFKYRMYNEPDYKEQITHAASNSRANHQNYIKNLQTGNKR